MSSINPHVKCCSYQPALPNFLVGQALADETLGEAGRALLRARIAADVAVTPLGLGRSPTYSLVYRHGSQQGFGRSRALRCAYYVEDGGLCGIWRHRNAVCATWFCKHVRGQVAATFWGAMKQLLTVLESDLAQWCLLELGLETSALERLMVTGLETGALTVADLDGRSDPSSSEAMWGSWGSRREELYVSCAKLVAPLDFGEALRRCGPEARVRVRILQDAWRRLSSPEAPARLRPGKLTVVRSGPTTCTVTTYSHHDPVEVHRALLDTLHHFDGGPTDRAVEAIEREGRMRLSKELVLRMSDFAVLVADEGRRVDS